MSTVLYDNSHCFCSLTELSAPPCSHLRRFAPGVETKCLFHFDEPVSPHLAVERAGKEVKFPTDSEFSAAVAQYARDFAAARATGESRRSALYIESAGGESQAARHNGSVACLQLICVPFSDRRSLSDLVGLISTGRVQATTATNDPHRFT